MKTLILAMLLANSAMAQNDCKAICKSQGTFFGFVQSCEFYCEKLLSKVNYVSHDSFTYFEYPRENISEKIITSKKAVVSNADAQCPDTPFQESGFFYDDQMVGWSRFQRTHFAFFSCQE